MRLDPAAESERSRNSVRLYGFRTNSRSLKGRNLPGSKAVQLTTGRLGLRALSQQLPEFLSQRRRREWLLNEILVTAEPVLQPDRTIGVSRHVEHSQFRPQRRHAFCELGAVQSRHDDIGQHQ